MKVDFQAVCAQLADIRDELARAHAEREAYRRAVTTLAKLARYNHLAPCSGQGECTCGATEMNARTVDAVLAELAASVG